MPTISPALVRCLPFVVFMALLTLRAHGGDIGGALALADMRWMYAWQAGAAAVVLMLWWNRYGELRDGAAVWRRPGGLLAALGVGLLIFGLWVLPDWPWMRQGGSAVGFVPLDAAGQPVWALVALRAAGAVVVVPVMEELFWRSFLMRWLDRRDFLELPPGEASPRALWLSSAVFAMAHDQWLVALLAGLAFGELYRRTGQIWLAVAAHAVANAALAAYVVSTGSWSYW